MVSRQHQHTEYLFHVLRSSKWHQELVLTVHTNRLGADHQELFLQLKDLIPVIYWYGLVR